MNSNRPLLAFSGISMLIYLIYPLPHHTHKIINDSNFITDYQWII